MRVLSYKNVIAKVDGFKFGMFYSIITALQKYIAYFCSRHKTTKIRDIFCGAIIAL